jgi:drug/metabolite transporter (DMT)-like permease
MMARARVAGIVLLLTGVVLAALRAPLDNRIGESAVLVAAAAAAAATTTIRLALLELAHRSTDDCANDYGCGAG